jgi:hypothetical protein
MSNPSPYIPSSASVPGAPTMAPDKRTQTIGLVALILGILEAVYALYQLLGSLLSGAFIHWEKSFFGGMPGASRSAMNPAMFDAMERMVRRIAVGQSLRMVAFLAVTAWLIIIAMQLRRGSIQALETAKSWTWLALGAIGLSILLQAFVLLPAQIAYQQEVFKTLPTAPGRPPPAGLMDGISMATNAMMVGTVFFGAILMAIWPIALRVWADRIQKEIRASG